VALPNDEPFRLKSFQNPRYLGTGEEAQPHEILLKHRTARGDDPPIQTEFITAQEPQGHLGDSTLKDVDGCRRGLFDPIPRSGSGGHALVPLVGTARHEYICEGDPENDCREEEKQAPHKKEYLRHGRVVDQKYEEQDEDDQCRCTDECELREGATPREETGICHDRCTVARRP